MKRLMMIFAILLVVAALGSPGFGLDYNAILKDIDEMMSFESRDYAATMTINQSDPEKGASRRVINQFRRDKEDKFLILILEPVAQKGQGYLRIEDNLWFYDPESRKFSHSSMKENFEGTDAKHSDFQRPSYASDYNVTGHTEGKLGKYEVYILDMKGKHNEVSYPFQKIWVRKDNHLLLKIESYSLNNRLMRTSLFPKYAKVENKYIPTHIIFEDELTPGKKTEIIIDNISMNPLPDKVFTKAYVEQVNR